MNSQLVLMNLKPGEDIGVETHAENDQFFRFESGTGLAIIDNNERSVSDGVIHKTKTEAEANDKEHFDGKTTEF